MLVLAPGDGQDAGKVLPPPKPELLPVTMPDPGGLEPGVREQLLALQSSIDIRLQAPGATNMQLSDAYGLLARVYHAYSLTPPAELCYRNAQLLAPQDFRWFYLPGLLFQSEARADEAIFAFQQARKLRPNYLATPVHLGTLYLQQNRLPEAQTLFNEALALDARCAAAYYGLGQVALSERRYHDAIKRFEEALANAPAANRINYSLAMAYRGLGETDKAKAYLEKQGTVGVRVSDPVGEGLQELVRGERLYLIRGRMAFDAGRFADAVAEFRQAVTANSDSVPAHINLGFALSQMEKTAEAIAEFQTALKLAPENPVANYNVGVLFAKQKQTEPAIKHLRVALASQPKDIEARLLLARTLLEASQKDDASVEYEKVVAAQPDEEDALLEWAQLLIRLKQSVKAQEVLEKAYASSPTRGRTAAALAFLLAAGPQLNLRNGTRSLELAQRIYMATNSVQHGALVALALAELGRCNEAAALQRRLVVAAENQKLTALTAKLKTNLSLFEHATSCRPDGTASSSP